MTTNPRPLKLISPAGGAQPEPAKPFGEDPSHGLDWSNEPTGLAPAGLEEWHRLGQVYGVDASKFTEGDRAAVRAYCSILADFLAAEEILNREGLTKAGRSSADKGAPVKHPAFQAKREASQQLRYWATALKLTPAARSLADRALEDTNNPFA